MPTFSSTNPMENIEVDEYILEKVQKAQERYQKRKLKALEDMSYRKRMNRARRKMERQNRRKGRK